jgi:hypothetical protein
MAGETRTWTLNEHKFLLFKLYCMGVGLGSRGTMNLRHPSPFFGCSISIPPSPALPDSHFYLYNFTRLPAQL